MSAEHSPIAVLTTSVTRNRHAVGDVVDVGFVITVDTDDGPEPAWGEATLLADGGRYDRWGNIDHWLDPRTIRFFEDLTERGVITMARRREAIDRICGACSMAAGEPRGEQ